MSILTSKDALLVWSSVEHLSDALERLEVICGDVPTDADMEFVYEQIAGSIDRLGLISGTVIGAQVAGQSSS